MKSRSKNAQRWLYGIKNHDDQRAPGSPASPDEDIQWVKGLSKRGVTVSSKPVLNHLSGVKESAEQMSFKDFVVESSRSVSQIDQLIRLGLGNQGGVDLNYYRRIMRDPQAAVRDPNLRTRLAEVFDKILDMVFDDSQLYQRVRLILQRQKLNEEEPDNHHFVPSRHGDDLAKLFGFRLAQTPSQDDDGFVNHTFTGQPVPHDRVKSLLKQRGYSFITQNDETGPIVSHMVNDETGDEAEIWGKPAWGVVHKQKSGHGINESVDPEHQHDSFLDKIGYEREGRDRPIFHKIDHHGYYDDEGSHSAQVHRETHKALHDHLTKQGYKASSSPDKRFKKVHTWTKGDDEVHLVHHHSGSHHVEHTHG